MTVNDYAACAQSLCTKRAGCARYMMLVTDPSSQVYIMPEDHEDCDLFWDIEDGAPFKLRTKFGGEDV